MLPHAPKPSDWRGAVDLPVALDDGCNSDNVIGIGDVPHVYIILILLGVFNRTGIVENVPNQGVPLPKESIA